MADNQEFYRLKLVLSMQDRLTARLKKIDEGVVKFEERMAKTQAVMDKFSNTKVEPRITLDTSTIEDRLNKTNELLEKIAKKTVEPKIKPKDETERTTSKVEGRLQKLTAKTWDITIKLKDKTISGLDKINNALTSPLGILGVGAGAVGIGGLITNSAQKSMDFTAEISNIKALTGMQGAEIEAVRQRALDLGKSTKYSALEAAQGMTELLKAGVDTKSVLGEASQAALDLAAAGDLSLTEAAEVMSTAMNVFGTKDATHVADLLAGAANASATDVHEMKYAFSQVAADAHGVGMSIDDVNVALATFAQYGQKGEKAGTGLRNMLNNLQPHTKPATETFSKFNFLDSNGNSVFYTAEGKLKSMAEIADIMQKNLGKLNPAELDMALYDMFGVEGKGLAKVIMEQGAKAFIAMEKEMKKFTASSVALEKLNNAKGDIEQLRGAFETFQIEALAPLEPAIRAVATAFTDFFSNADTLEYVKSNVAGISDEIVAFMDNLASDEKFQQMQWGDKIVFLLDQMMIKMDEWASGSGGEQFGKVMTKLAEIGIKAFVGALTGMIKAAFNSAIEGNFSSAISLGLGSAFMASILPLSGIFKIVKNTIDFGKNIKTGSYWLGDAYSSGTSTTSKILKKIPVIGAIFDGYRFLTSDDKAKTGTEIIGGWGGAWAGSKIGAGIGGAIGSIIPGVGTAIGAGVGSVFGGVGGYWLGSNTVSSIIDPQNNSFMNEHGQSQIQNSNMQLETAKAQSAMMNEILESAGEKINRLKELGAEGWNSLGENASMNLERMRYGLSSARESILQATNTISEDFGEMSNSISEWCSTIVTDVTSWFAQIPDRVGQAIDEAVARANAGLSDLKISAWNALPAPLRDTIDWGAKKLGIKGYANGGFLNQDQIIRVAEGNNAEVIIPLHSSKRQRGLSLWQQAGQMLGVNSNLFTNVTNNNYMPAMAYALSSGNTSDNGKSNNSNNAFSFNGLNIHIGNNKSDDEMASAIGWKILAEVKQAYQNRG
ncbi:phage tail tape measure protein [Megamonas funiformis]|uniref:Phage tail tape measure protein, TP901 family, core region n=1 Tax=Megamonas funiformis YIT 11815 TaxID=742816 RepID=A0ABN0EJA0_9FIRM|nr:phage tail tape measure protein [Megamonas funiformis]EHR37698.1 phage tail tape measure protein, TP901 family, core region [Megamonas funiformis YIT 11815]QIB59746.1 phage tail tape measure protein [Megamonas funiformis]